MPTISAESGYETFVNVFHVSPGTQDEVVRILVRISDEVAARHAGFVSATTHASRDGRLVINYLQWTSQSHLEAMQTSPEFRALARHFGGLLTGFDEVPCTIAHVREAPQD